ncbi:LPXTG cell wall anchor domain-containing protein [Streptomyces sp. NPDC012508]|uniref:LPXTG cell wall anchor domain-containing protein n=1 Tax=Streptomyces sp. NPDC012508 TaxID=3364837 RepID=UPI00368756BE
MRLRNALALGVTAATTGTAVLALAVGPSSAEPGPNPGPGSGSEAEAGSDSASVLDPGPGLHPAPGLNAGSGLNPGSGAGLRADTDSGFRLRTNADADTTAASDADTGSDAAPDSGTGPTPGPAADSGPGPGSGTRHQQQPLTCGKVTDPEFPIDTRIHGRPGVFVPGAGSRTFEIDLTNTTADACHSIHPVLALADRERVLRPEQIRLDFYDSEARLWRPVVFEATEEDENVGVFTDFPGFTVPAGGTVTVPVRLAFREDTAANEVVATAAIVQRQGADGDWVGESDDFRLTIGPEGTEADPEENSEANPEANSQENAEGHPEGNPEGNPEVAPSGTTPPESGDTGLPPAPTRPELAHTGPDSSALLAPASGALLLTGASLVAASRRGRRRPG